ncbi:MAG: FecR family protein [Bdellovibrionota bacterium]
MRFHSLLSRARPEYLVSLLLLSASLDSHAQTALKPRIGTVALIEGEAVAQPGQVKLNLPDVGEDVITVEQDATRKKHIKKSPLQAPRLVVSNAPSRKLKANDPIFEGDLIQSDRNGRVKILFRDRSIMDLGPLSVIEVERFAVSSSGQNVKFNVLHGRIRNIVPQELKKNQRYEIATPSALIKVRGAEVVLKAAPVRDARSKLELTALHGRLSIDVIRHNPDGIVYYQPVAIGPGVSFSNESAGGIQSEMDVRPLSQMALREKARELSPAVNALATETRALIGPRQLPGTGLALITPLHEPEDQEGKSQQIANTFDTDHPPLERRPASASGNFTTPREFSLNAAAFGHMPDFRRATGPAPVSQLPATISRVKINLRGL